MNCTHTKWRKDSVWHAHSDALRLVFTPSSALRWSPCASWRLSRILAQAESNISALSLEVTLIALTRTLTMARLNWPSDSFDCRMCVPSRIELRWLSGCMASFQIRHIESLIEFSMLASEGGRPLPLAYLKTRQQCLSVCLCVCTSETLLIACSNIIIVIVILQEWTVFIPDPLDSQVGNLLPTSTCSSWAVFLARLHFDTDT